jgi:2-succinyl-6-hydroxy-2,4-cyclohexadiene-1-carboxylate synthase
MTALVLLHGFTGHAASFQRLLATLPLQTRTSAPLLLGHDGQDPPDESPVPFSTEVARLAEEIRRAHHEPVHLVGYSLGARLALGLLVAHRELFTGATLVGVHPGLDTGDERAARAAADERWAQLLYDRGLDAFLAEWQDQPLFATQARLPAAARAAQDAVRRRHSARGLAWALRSLGLAQMPDYWPALGRIPLPVRLVVGALDEKFVALGERATRLLPRAQLVRVPDVGHNVLLEAPDALAALL